MGRATTEKYLLKKKSFKVYYHFGSLGKYTRSGRRECREGMNMGGGGREEGRRRGSREKVQRQKKLGNEVNKFVESNN